MLIDLAKPLTTGETIQITLTFEKAGPQTVEAEVRDTAP
jgi:copper(I)-binding protein